eukprot:TRINITY_DN137_c1_g1_i2.p1 TRINITY_DN137_c1_g1~~TRINITY_DN137_c1_g1_i2.p1  ORF type:complete len:186 (-),score=36.80 TRINITY_DN137_c1_g1_i2:699-1256(-)
MRVVFISDTHQMHELCEVPNGDVLIHSGDFCNHEKPEERDNFAKFLKALPHKYKIIIGGNHDGILCGVEVNEFADSFIVLSGSGINIEGLRIAGFNYSEHHYYPVPEDIDGVDILVTHMPPPGILSLCEKQTSVADEAIQVLQNQISPSLHVFGHAHRTVGLHVSNNTLLVNSSVFHGLKRFVCL